MSVNDTSIICLRNCYLCLLTGLNFEKGGKESSQSRVLYVETTYPSLDNDTPVLEQDT
jgi:hypothetical protein